MSTEMWILWLIIMVGCIAVELATVGLTTIWFAGGALAALIAYGAKAPLILQIILFIAVSLILLITTRPFAVKCINKRLHYKSNYESNIGKIVIITEDVDNIAGTGKATLEGMEWSARSAEDATVIKIGAKALVKDVQGVKLILEQTAN